MFVIYPAGTGNDITISPRQSPSGHAMPVLNPYINCTLVDGPVGNFRNTVMYSANVHCTNASTWTTQDKQHAMLSITGNQNFIFGQGPTTDTPSGGNNNIDIKQHPYDPAAFTLNMTYAVTNNGPGHIPTTAEVAQNSGSTDSGWEDFQPEWSTAIHGIFMIASFVIIFPLGAFWMFQWKKVILHQMTQGLGVLAVLIGMGIGIWAATKYKRWGAHPFIGLAIVALVLVQVGLGLMGHRKFKKTQQKNILGRTHRFFGPLVMLIGIANAFYGFVYAARGGHAIGLAILLIAVALIFGFSWWTQKRRQRKLERMQAAGMPGAQGYPNPYPQGTQGFAPPPGHPPGQYAPPGEPAYGGYAASQGHNEYGSYRHGQESGLAPPQRPAMYHADSNDSRGSIELVEQRPKGFI